MHLRITSAVTSAVLQADFARSLARAEMGARLEE
jgi:hypothetical protein